MRASEGVLDVEDRLLYEHFEFDDRGFRGRYCARLPRRSASMVSFAPAPKRPL